MDLDINNIAYRHAKFGHQKALVKDIEACVVAPLQAKIDFEAAMCRSTEALLRRWEGACRTAESRLAKLERGNVPCVVCGTYRFVLEGSNSDGVRVFGWSLSSISKVLQAMEKHQLNPDTLGPFLDRMSQQGEFPTLDQYLEVKKAKEGLEMKMFEAWNAARAHAKTVDNLYFS